MFKLFYREKWTLFDESTRVPLLISHPKSPFQGQHYKDPVELIDVFATLKDLLQAPFDENKVYKGIPKVTLQGKSLAPVVLGKQLWEKAFPQKTKEPQFFIRSSNALNNASSAATGNIMPVMQRTFAITQSTRCAKKNRIPPATVGDMIRLDSSKSKKILRRAVWEDCNVDYKGNDEVALIGYSMRTADYRYTAYFHYNKTSFLGKVQVDVVNPPYQHELYDHKNETLQDFTHRETVNLAYKPSYTITVNQLKSKLIHFIQNEAIFHKN